MDLAPWKHETPHRERENREKREISHPGVWKRKKLENSGGLIN